MRVSTPYTLFENVDLDNVYLMWKHIDADDLTKPLGDGLASARDSDGSDEVLRDLAREAARQVKMRLEG